MTRHVIRRIGQAVLVTWLVTLITFVLSRSLPGGAAKATLGKEATQQQLAKFIHDMGYDQSIFIQYKIWLGGILTGDLGYSYKLNMPVSQAIADALPKTLLLVGLSTAFALAVAVPLGTAQALRANGLMDRVVGSMSFLLYAMPTFLLGILLVMFFAVKLGWFSVSAPSGSSVLDILGQPKDLVLPVLTLSASSIAVYSRFVRSSVLDTLASEYVRTARAKGLGRREVLLRHVLPNSMTSVVTLLGLSVPILLTGAVIVEQVFNYPGMGLLFWTQAQYNDYPTELAIVVLASGATVIGNLFADLGYAILDPRVRA